MVKPRKLTKKQKEILKKAGEFRLAGPCSHPSINLKEMAKIAEKIRVKVISLNP